MPHNTFYTCSGKKNASETYYITVNKQTGIVTFMPLPIGSNPNGLKNKQKNRRDKKQKTKKTKKNCK